MRRSESSGVAWELSGAKGVSMDAPPRGRKWPTTPVALPGKPLGPRSHGLCDRGVTESRARLSD